MGSESEKFKEKGEGMKGVSGRKASRLGRQ